MYIDSGRTHVYKEQGKIERRPGKWSPTLRGSDGMVKEGLWGGVYLLALGWGIRG